MLLQLTMQLLKFRLIKLHSAQWLICWMSFHLNPSHCKFSFSAMIIQQNRVDLEQSLKNLVRRNTETGKERNMFAESGSDIVTC